MSSSCLVILLIVFASTAKAKEKTEHQMQLNGGYFLLYKLCDEEAQLPLLTDIKTTPPQIVDFAKRISIAAKQTTSSLEELQEKDSAIVFDQNPLPRFERDVRESISAEKKHQLLFGTSNENFVRALLVSQIQASNYASNLAKVLSDQENDPTRVKVLQQIESQWESLTKKAYQLLKNADFSAK